MSIDTQAETLQLNAKTDANEIEEMDTNDKNNNNIGTLFV